MNYLLRSIKIYYLKKALMEKNYCLLILIEIQKLNKNIYHVIIVKIKNKRNVLNEMIKKKIKRIPW